MKEAAHPFGGNAPESVFVLLDPEADSDKRDRLFKWLEAVLPLFNWRSHLFILDNGPSSGTSARAVEESARIVSDFLSKHKLATAYLHPVVTMRSWGARERAEWERLSAPTKPFQDEAYQEQGEPRLGITPIIELTRDISTEDALEAAEFFSSRSATPSFYLRGRTPERLSSEAQSREIRLYLDPDGPGGMAGQLWVNHVFETLLDRVDEKDGGLLAPCRNHLIADEKSGGLFSCFKRWEEGKPAASLGEESSRDLHLPGAAPRELCPGCICRSLLSMKENLEANGREKEGREVYFRLGLATSGRGDHRLAAELAHHAFALSDGDENRAAALICEGLCYLNLNELEKADQALELAAKYAVDQGFVAYQRGRVQFAWRDYLQALDRFAEALKAASEQVPPEDVCFQMALCHIHIEEYAEARSHLERCLKPGEKAAPVSFYRGICDLGEGQVEAAMSHFEDALLIGPAEEDLGRVLFYLGTCLKELERFDEAIEMLKKAVETDPEDLANHNLLGFCYYRTKRHQEAVQCFRRAVEIDPRSAIDWANLGSNLRDLGRIDEAVAMYEKALSLDPNIAFARENLSRLAKWKGGND